MIGSASCMFCKTGIMSFEYKMEGKHKITDFSFYKCSKCNACAFQHIFPSTIEHPTRVVNEWLSGDNTKIVNTESFIQEEIYEP